MVEGVAGAEDGFLAAHDFPGCADSWLEGCPIHLYAGRVADSILTCNEKISRCGDVVGEAIVLFGGGSCHVPGQAEVEGQRGCDAPIVFDEGAVDLPTAAGHRSVVGLVVNGEAGDAKQEIRLSIAGDAGAAEAGKVAKCADNPEAVLECFGAHIHLIGAEVEPGLDVMLAADDVERIPERKDVGSTLEG